MAGIFSLWKSKGKRQERQETPSSTKRSVNRLLSRARRHFRRGDNLEPSPPSAQKSLPHLPPIIGSLREETDSRLLFCETSDSDGEHSSSPASPEAADTRILTTLGCMKNSLTFSSLPTSSILVGNSSIYEQVPSSLATEECPLISQGNGVHDGFSSVSEAEGVNRDIGKRDADCEFQTRIIQPSGEHANATFFQGIIDQEDCLGLQRLFEEHGSNSVVELRGQLGQDLDSASKSGSNSKLRYVAQSASAIDATRQSRKKSAQALGAALAKQKEKLQRRFDNELLQQQRKFESFFEESHDSSAKLHSIELLNLQDDHEAEAKDLEEAADGLRARLASFEKSAHTSSRRMNFFENRCISAEKKLKDQCKKYEELLQASQEPQSAITQQAVELSIAKKEMSQMRHQLSEQACQGQREGDKLRQTNARLEDQLEAHFAEYNDMSLDRQSKEEEVQAFRTQLNAADDELRQRDDLCQDLQSRLNFLVAEKVRDYTWHVAQDNHPQSMRPMNTEDEIAKASGDLKELVQEKEKVVDHLNAELDTIRMANSNRFKKLKRVISKQSQEKVVLEMALSIAQDQRGYWAGEFDAVAEAATNKSSFTCYLRAVAERHILEQRTRLDLDRVLLEAKLRGDRAVLDRAICKKHEAIKTKKRDAEIESLKQNLEAMTFKFEHENTLALLYKDSLDKEMPGLRERNGQVERLLADQLQKNVHADHSAVIEDVLARNHELEMFSKYWEGQANQQYQEIDSIKADCGLLQAGVFNDLTTAHAWRDERDSLSIENNALRERFAVELGNSPLVIPSADLERTTKAIEDQFSLDNINDALLKHFQFTWSAVPKTLVSADAAPWDYIRSEFGEDIAEVRKKLAAEREDLLASYQDGVVQLPSELEWINDPKEMEAMWKGTWRRDGCDSLGSSSSSTTVTAVKKGGPAGSSDYDFRNSESSCSAKGKGKQKAVGLGLGADGQEEVEGEDYHDPCADFF